MVLCQIVNRRGLSPRSGNAMDQVPEDGRDPPCRCSILTVSPRSPVATARRRWPSRSKDCASSIAAAAASRPRRRLKASIWRCRAARSSACWARTAPASRP